MSVRVRVRVAPPHAVPPTRAKCSSSSTRTMETPEPMLTSRKGKSGSGQLTATCGATVRGTYGLWCHGTRYVRHTRGRYAYSVRTVGHWMPCAAGTYSTQETGTRSPYVQ